MYERRCVIIRLCSMEFAPKGLRLLMRNTCTQRACAPYIHASLVLMILFLLLIIWEIKGNKGRERTQHLVGKEEEEEEEKLPLQQQQQQQQRQQQEQKVRAFCISNSMHLSNSSTRIYIIA